MNFTYTSSIGSYCLHKQVIQERCAILSEILKLDEQTQVGVIFMSAPEIAEYNQQYRKKEGPTNVLSFPTDTADHEFGIPEHDLGDILISVDTAQEEAKQQNVSLHHRLTQLIIHGMLHLLGYDHERSEKEAIEMWDMEQDIIKQILKTRRIAMPHLAINIDHVATVRQARGGDEPDPVTAATLCELAGAQGIVAHLREDRRHLQDRDVHLLRQMIKTKLNLEMAIVDEIIDIAVATKPDMVTFVPEKRKELTTEGGLDVVKNLKKVKKAVATMTDAGIPVSLFIDPDATQIEASVECGATFVELHTGRYSDAPDEQEQAEELQLIATMSELAYESGLKVNAGHGLDYRNTAAVAAIPFIEELSIGHAVISRAVMTGLDQAVREMHTIIKEAAGQAA